MAFFAVFFAADLRVVFFEGSADLDFLAEVLRAVVVELAFFLGSVSSLDSAVCLVAVVSFVAYTAPPDLSP